MKNSNENTVSFLGENKKKKFVHQLEEVQEVKMQDASQVGSPQKRLAAVTSKITIGEETNGR